jgi:hypothetical protein
MEPELVGKYVLPKARAGYRYRQVALDVGCNILAGLSHEKATHLWAAADLSSLAQTSINGVVTVSTMPDGSQQHHTLMAIQASKFAYDVAMNRLIEFDRCKQTAYSFVIACRESKDPETVAWINEKWLVC